MYLEHVKIIADKYFSPVHKRFVASARAEQQFSAVLDQLSYQANWELVIMWVHDKPLNSNLYRSII